MGGIRPMRLKPKVYRTRSFLLRSHELRTFNDLIAKWENEGWEAVASTLKALPDGNAILMQKKVQIKSN